MAAGSGAPTTTIGPGHNTASLAAVPSPAAQNAARGRPRSRQLQDGRERYTSAPQLGHLVGGVTASDGSQRLLVANGRPPTRLNSYVAADAFKHLRLAASALETILPGIRQGLRSLAPLKQAASADADP